MILSTQEGLSYRETALYFAVIVNNLDATKILLYQNASTDVNDLHDMWVWFKGYFFHAFE